MQIKFDENKMPSEIVIVGGGISGLLLALKLSKEYKNNKNNIILIEKQTQLGGRFFFSSSDLKNHLSGPGFEFMEASSLEILFRHFELHLTDEEKNELDKYFHAKNDSEISIDLTKKNQCFFVKKEFVSDVELISGTSDILTKKESEILKSFIYDYYQANHYNENDKEYTKEMVSFEKSTHWAELPKSTKDSLVPILSTILGPGWEKAPFSNVCKLLRSFFETKRELIPKFFHRKMCFEFAIEKILKERGVIIHTQCEVLRVNYTKEKKFQLLLLDELKPLNKIIFCSKLVFAIPLATCLGVLAKEYFSASQSRFVSKVKPVSLVFSEISDFQSVKSQIYPEFSGAGDTLVFPVERVQGFLTNDGRILFSTQLEYEESLKAPSVREAISRLRKAAARVLKAEEAEKLKKGAQIPQNKILERIVLLPVAFTMPCDAPINIEVKETKMGLDGLFCCGDSFPGFADEPWKMVVNSVNDVAAQLS